MCYINYTGSLRIRKQNIKNSVETIDIISRYYKLVLEFINFDRLLADI